MKKIFKISFVVSIILISLILSGNTFQKSNDIPTSTPTPSLTPIQITQQDTEIGLLKLEIELLKEHNKKLLDTIHWSLSIVFTTTLFIVGAGWFSNFRLYEKDKVEFKKSINTSLEDKFNNIQGNFNTELTEKFNDIRRNLESTVNKSVQNKSDELQMKFNDLQEEVLKMQLDLLEDEAESWNSKKVYTNELSCYFEMLKIALRLSPIYSSWKLSVALEGMEESLKNGANVDVEKSSEIFQVLERVDQSFCTDVQILKELIIKSRNSKN